MRTLKIATLVFFVLLTAACKDKKKAGDEAGGSGGGGGGTTTAPSAKLVTVDISAGGEDFQGHTVQAPEGAVAKESFGAVEVTAGEGFTLQISSSAKDMASLKKEIGENDINKLKRFVVDTADEQVYESEVMSKSQFHFNVNVKVGDKTFSCENVKGGADKTLAQTQAMVAACKSIAAVAAGGGNAAGSDTGGSADTSGAGSGEPTPK